MSPRRHSHLRSRHSSLTGLFHKHPVAALWLLFMVARLPYMILEWPGCFYPDTTESVEQFFGFAGFTTQLCTTDPSVVLTNHHPVIYTLLYGGTFALGNMCGSQAVAMFMFLLLQAALHSWVLARLLNRLRHSWHTGSLWPWWCVVIFFVLFPPFGFWSTTMLKDTFFSTCMLWLMLLLLEVVQSGGRILRKPLFVIYFVAVTLLFMLSKNQCAYIVALLMLTTVVFYRPARWRLTLSLAVPLLLYELFLHILLPHFNVALSGRQELHGFMFQQTALYMKQHPNDVRPEERKAIAAVLPIDKLAKLHDPDLQDPVKFRYKVGASDAEFAAYRKVHLAMMMRHPETGLESLWLGCKDYFIPTARFPLFYPSLSVDNPPKRGFYKLRALFQPQPSGMQAIMTVPVVGWLFRMGLYVILSLLVCVLMLLLRRWNALLVMLPIIISIGVLIVSPQNGCFRYVMPIVWATPISLLLLQLPHRTHR